jgi:hypothetical protein
MAKVTQQQSRVLRALLRGHALKSHRYLDGRKMFKLHPLQGPPTLVRRITVDALRRRGMIESNKKFPAATFLLTDEGRRVAGSLEREDD